MLGFSNGINWFGDAKWYIALLQYFCKKILISFSSHWSLYLSPFLADDSPGAPSAFGRAFVASLCHRCRKPQQCALRTSLEMPAGYLHMLKILWYWLIIELFQWNLARDHMRSLRFHGTNLVARIQQHHIVEAQRGDTYTLFILHIYIYIHTICGYRINVFWYVVFWFLAVSKVDTRRRR